jgi:hypothetical protein
MSEALLTVMELPATGLTTPLFLHSGVAANLFGLEGAAFFAVAMLPCQRETGSTHAISDRQMEMKHAARIREKLVANRM